MKIYQTYRNQDLTEGRGPFVPDQCFLYRKHAEEYIDVQEGVMGRRAKWSTEKYGDWSVREVEVIEHSLIDAAKEREKLIQSAKAKLTPLEIEAIGLTEPSTL